ncbi:MAG TPA: tetratricopeptide repeat protein [Pyrinomonadaceae bacterium]|nr:tetratricopeptide repeat protein [Pyrinomonadaceae bacterium]
MRKNFLTIFLGVSIGAVVALIVMAVSGTGVASRPEAGLLQPVKTDQATVTDRNIKAAQGVIEKQPGNPTGYNMLAAAFMQKARETGDFSLNARAEESLKHSFRVAPDNYDGTKLQAALLLNYHRFAEALEAAQRARKINPRDHDVYGAMVDALVELGDYKAAVDAAQQMVDLKPNTASYSRVSYLRSLHGDTKGAIAAMKMAVESASPQNPENIAWSRVHLGDELMNDGQLTEAEREYDHALYLFPDYHAALAAKARARYAAGDTDNAIIFYKRAAERVPLPEYIAPLGDLYAKLGRADEARQQYEQVEFIEKMGGAAGETYSRQLALFWADHDVRLDEALAVAERERAARGDIYTFDALAWCLYKKGRFEEAKTAVNEALRLNTRDARLLFHAGMISLAVGDNQKGADYLKQALAINPSFDILQAEVAREKLNSLKSAHSF